jgi:PAS domain S-box-containing protein
MSAETSYRAVAEQLPDAAVVLFDQDLRLQLATGTALPDPAWCADHHVGRTVVELVPAEQAERLTASYRAALAGTRQHLETPGWRGPGQYWAVDVVPLRGDGGAVSGGMAFWRDISKRHRAEEALRQHRRQLVEAQRLARVGSWEWDLASDRMRWSPELYRRARQAEQERQRLLGRLYELLEGQHQRLAADLHDGHLQSLAAIGLRLDQAAARLDRGDVALVGGLLRRLRQETREEVVALRRTITALRPLLLDRRGLAAAVGELATATGARAGLDACEVTVDLDGAPLDPEVETALFRVAQQALANVDQHAGARRLRVALYRDGPQVVLVVEDDGRGFDPAHAQAVADSHGFGLTCMRERVQAIGGQFLLHSAPGGGTRIQVRAAARAPS